VAGVKGRVMAGEGETCAKTLIARRLFVGQPVEQGEASKPLTADALV
jgi:hypothetical protein